MIAPVLSYKSLQLAQKDREAGDVFVLRISSWQPEKAQMAGVCME